MEQLLDRLELLPDPLRAKFSPPVSSLLNPPSTQLSDTWKQHFICMWFLAMLYWLLHLLLIISKYKYVLPWVYDPPFQYCSGQHSFGNCLNTFIDKCITVSLLIWIQESAVVSSKSEWKCPRDTWLSSLSQWLPEENCTRKPPMCEDEAVFINQYIVRHLLLHQLRDRLPVPAGESWHDPWPLLNPREALQGLGPPQAKSRHSNPSYSSYNKRMLQWWCVKINTWSA